MNSEQIVDMLDIEVQDEPLEAQGNSQSARSLSSKTW